MRWPWQRKPTAPEGVRFVLATGDEVPVNCTYLGKDDEGLHVWEPAWCPNGPIRNMRVAVLPPRTSLRLPEEMLP